METTPVNTRAVLVGCGGMSATWLDAAALTPNLEIVGLVDLDQDAARNRCKEYSLEGAFLGPHLAPALEATNPDVVFDVTVPSAHKDVTITALEHGCHVLGEKPLADSMANARLIIAAAEKANRVYAVIQNRRYDAGIRAVRAALESGVIGRVHTIHGEFFLGAHFGGFRAAMQHALILDMAIHTFDQARFLSRTDPRAVYCREWNPPGSWFAHGASASAIFDMTGDLVFTYNGCWCAEGYRTNWNSNWLIIGDNGTLRWNGASEVQIQQPGEPEGLTRRPVDVPLEVGALDKAQRAHRGLISEFLHCVRNGDIPETVCTDNIKSLAMVFGAIESAESGNKVAIEA